MELLVALLGGAAVALTLVGLGLSRMAPSVVTDRLDRYGRREAPTTMEELELSESFYTRVIKPLITNISRVAIRLAPGRSVQQTELKLARAGYPNGWTVADFWGVRGLAAVVAGGLPLIFFLMRGAGLSPRNLGITLFMLLFGYFMPNTWLDRKVKARQHSARKALPDALDLMTVSVEAGLGFDAALQKVADKWDNELSRAFQRVGQEMRVGRTRREALRDMAERIDVDDVSAFIAAVLQADTLGVSMAKVLRIQSEQMRIRRRQRAEEQAQKAPIKMLFPMVFLIFPALFIVLLGPAVIILINTFGGGGPGG